MCSFELKQGNNFIKIYIKTFNWDKHTMFSIVYNAHITRKV